jgi:hypothetical protein
MTPSFRRPRTGGVRHVLLIYLSSQTAAEAGDLASRTSRRVVAPHASTRLGRGVRRLRIVRGRPQARKERGDAPEDRPRTPAVRCGHAQWGDASARVLSLCLISTRAASKAARGRRTAYGGLAQTLSPTQAHLARAYVGWHEPRNRLSRHGVARRFSLRPGRDSPSCL